MNIIADLNLDVIHTQTEFSIGTLGRKAAKDLNIPLIHTYHTIYEQYTHYLKAPNNHNGYVKSVIRKLSKNICNKAEAVVVPTEKVASLLKSYGVTKEIIIQPTGINLNKFENFDDKAITELKEKYDSLPSDKVLIFIGRVSQEKNIDEIVTLLAEERKKHSDLKLFIIGDGPAKKHIEELVDELALNDIVIFTGSVEWDKIQDYYRLGDIFVCASTSETQGLTYLEAMAARRAVLVREDECLKDFLIDGENGYTFNDKKEFSNKLTIMFSDPQKLDKLKENAYQTACKNDLIHFTANIAEVYARSIRKHDEIQICNEVNELITKSFKLKIH